jgi:hypothetical protein
MADRLPMPSITVTMRSVYVWLIASTLGVACGSTRAKSSDESVEPCAAKLALPQEALDAECWVKPDQVAGRYRLAGPGKSAVLRKMIESLERSGWRPLAEDFLNPGTPTSHVVGWRKASTEDGDEQWLGHWQNAAGEGLAYELGRRGAGDDTLKVYGAWLPKATMTAAPVDAEVPKPASGPESHWSRYCVAAGPGLAPAPQPQCAARKGMAVMRSHGNLALRPGVAVTASSELGGHSATSVTDGWLECPEWRPAVDDAKPNLTIDLKTLANVSSVGIQATGDVHVTVTAGLESSSMRAVDDYELRDQKARLSSLVPGIAARYVQITFRPPGGEVSGAAPDHRLAVREIEVFGGCVRPWE